MSIVTMNMSDATAAIRKTLRISILRAADGTDRAGRPAFCQPAWRCRHGDTGNP
jgi:hypothetical protein